MALQRIIQVTVELRENRCQTPPPLKKLLKSKAHSYNKWTHVHLHQDPT